MKGDLEMEGVVDVVENMRWRGYHYIPGSWGKNVLEGSEGGFYVQTITGKYSGEVNISGRPHGGGTYILDWSQFPRKLVVTEYRGRWKDGHFHGKGVVHYSNGDVYEGDFVTEKHLEYPTRRTGVMEGVGSMKYSNGDVYDGDWKAGLPYGNGMMSFSEGGSYTGDWYHGRFMGQKWPYWGHGVMEYSNGDVYIGQFCENRRHGKGTLETSCGSVMKGHWHRGKFETRWSGVNTANYTTGHSYEGEFKGGRFHGMGVLKYPNGDIYQGNFKMDRLYGVGVMTYADGAIYEGPWNQDPFDLRRNKNAE